jgi:hypothetical protein
MKKFDKILKFYEHARLFSAKVWFNTLGEVFGIFMQKIRTFPFWVQPAVIIIMTIILGIVWGLVAYYSKKYG